MWTIEESNAYTCQFKAKYADESSAMTGFYTGFPRRLNTKRRREQAKRRTLYICSHCGYIHLSQRGTQLKSNVKVAKADA